MFENEETGALSRRTFVMISGAAGVAALLTGTGAATGQAAATPSRRSAPAGHAQADPGRDAAQHRQRWLLQLVPSPTRESHAGVKPHSVMRPSHRHESRSLTRVYLVGSVTEPSSPPAGDGIPQPGGRTPAQSMSSLRVLPAAPLRDPWVLTRAARHPRRLWLNALLAKLAPWWMQGGNCHPRASS